MLAKERSPRGFIHAGFNLILATSDQRRAGLLGSFLKSLALPTSDATSGTGWNDAHGSDVVCSPLWSRGCPTQHTHRGKPLLDWLKVLSVVSPRNHRGEIGCCEGIPSMNPTGRVLLWRCLQALAQQRTVGVHPVF